MLNCFQTQENSWISIKTIFFLNEFTTRFFCGLKTLYRCGHTDRWSYGLRLNFILEFNSYVQTVPNHRRVLIIDKSLPHKQRRAFTRLLIFFERASQAMICRKCRDDPSHRERTEGSRKGHANHRARWLFASTRANHRLRTPRCSWIERKP